MTLSVVLQATRNRRTCCSDHPHLTPLTNEQIPKGRGCCLQSSTVVECHCSGAAWALPPLRSYSSFPRIPNGVSSRASWETQHRIESMADNMKESLQAFFFFHSNWINPPIPCQRPSRWQSTLWFSIHFVAPCWSTQLEKLGLTHSVIPWNRMTQTGQDVCVFVRLARPHIVFMESSWLLKKMPPRCSQTREQSLKVASTIKRDELNTYWSCVSRRVYTHTTQRTSFSYRSRPLLCAKVSATRKECNRIDFHQPRMLLLCLGVLLCFEEPFIYSRSSAA